MRSLMLGTAAALALATGVQAQAALVIEGTKTAPDDLVGQTVYAAGGGAGDPVGAGDAPGGWVPIGVITELTPPGGGVEISFAPGLMEEQDAVDAKVSADRLRLIPDRDEPNGYFVLLDVTGTPLAKVVERDELARPAAGDAEGGSELLGDGASAANQAELAPEPEPDAEVVVETDAELGDRPLREVDITDPDAPPIEDATNVVPEGDPSDEAQVPESVADTALTSPSHTAATPALDADSGMRPAAAPEEFAVADMSTMDPTELLGVRVYSGDGDRIGEVDRWIGEAPGRLPKAAVVSVGGLLGVGDREVAIDTDLLTLMASTQGNDLRVYVELTEDEIEGLPDSAD